MSILKGLGTTNQINPHSQLLSEKSLFQAIVPIQEHVLSPLYLSSVQVVRLLSAKISFVIILFTVKKNINNTHLSK